MTFKNYITIILCFLLLASGERLIKMSKETGDRNQTEENKISVLDINLPYPIYAPPTDAPTKSPICPSSSPTMTYRPTLRPTRRQRSRRPFVITKVTPAPTSQPTPRPTRRQRSRRPFVITKVTPAPTSQPTESPSCNHTFAPIVPHYIIVWGWFNIICLSLLLRYCMSESTSMYCVVYTSQLWLFIDYDTV